MLRSDEKLRRPGVFLFFLAVCLVLISSEMPAREFDQNTYYRLVAKHSGLVLDVNLGKGEQANIVQASWHGGDNQRWKIEPVK